MYNVFCYYCSFISSCLAKHYSWSLCIDTERRSQHGTGRRPCWWVRQFAFQSFNTRLSLQLWSRFLQLCSLHSATTTAIFIWKRTRLSLCYSKDIPCVSSWDCPWHETVSWHCTTYSSWYNTLRASSRVYSVWCIFTSTYHGAINFAGILGEEIYQELCMWSSLETEQFRLQTCR